MDRKWLKVAERIVSGLGVQPGELIDLRDTSGCLEAVMETALAIERAGATPLVQLVPADYLERLWAEAPVSYLEQWDQHRQSWMGQVDRVAVLAGADTGFKAAANPGRDAWQQAQYRLTQIEEARQLPYLLVAIPSPKGASQLGLEPAEMESLLLPALEANPEAIRQEINRVLDATRDGNEITIHSGDQHILYLDHGDRTWLNDDGCIDDDDRARGAIVSTCRLDRSTRPFWRIKPRAVSGYPKLGRLSRWSCTLQPGGSIKSRPPAGQSILSGSWTVTAGNPAA